MKLHLLQMHIKAFKVVCPFLHFTITCWRKSMSEFRTHQKDGTFAINIYFLQKRLQMIYSTIVSIFVDKWLSLSTFLSIIFRADYGNKSEKTQPQFVAETFIVCLLL